MRFSKLMQRYSLYSYQPNFSATFLHEHSKRSIFNIHSEAQRKKLRDISYDDMGMRINICRVFSNTTYPWSVAVYSYSSRSIMFFWAQKNEKARHWQKQSFCALFRSCKQHPSVTQNLPQTTFRSVIGDKRTRFSRNNSNINMHRSNRLLSCFRCLNGCLLCFR